MVRLNGQLESTETSIIQQNIDELSFGAGGRAFTDVLFVSPDGDNTDGSEWEQAYTTLQAALNASSSDVNVFTLILIAPGDYDINETGDPTFSNNIEVRGSHRNSTEIKNDHATATSVLKFTGIASMVDVTIHCGAGSNDGLIFDGSGANGSRLKRVYIEADEVTGAQDGITLSGGCKYVKFDDVRIHGVVTHTKGLHLNNSPNNDFRNIQIHECLIGLHLDHLNDDDNVFEDLVIHGSTTAILIDSGSDNDFRNVALHRCTTNLSDSGSNNTYDNFHHDSEFLLVIPNTAGNGVTITGAGANAYGAWVQMDDGTGFTKHFEITGAYVDDFSDKFQEYMFQIGIGAGGSEIPIATTKFHGTDGRSSNVVNGIESGVIPKGTRVAVRTQSDGGGNETFDVWIQYKDI